MRVKIVEVSANIEARTDTLLPDITTLKEDNLLDWSMGMMFDCEPYFGYPGWEEDVVKGGAV